MYRYRERERECSSDSDEDGLTTANITRHNKIRNDVSTSSAAMDTDLKREVPSINNGNKKRKINNIWASVVQEQTINDDLCKVSMNRISDRLGWDRGSESYDFTRKSEDTRPDSEDEDEEIDLDYGVSDIENEFEASETNFPNGDKPLKLKSKSESKVHVVERLEDAEKIARDVARRLHEPKVELIVRCVQILGRKKIFDLLHMTEDIEESGGMLIVNGTRRRTAGGVFLYQLRKDSRITKKEKNYIFSEDKDKEVKLKKAQRKLVRKKNAMKLNPKPSKMETDLSGSKEDCTDKTAVENFTAGSAGTNQEVESTVKQEKEEMASDVELEEGEIP